MTEKTVEKAWAYFKQLLNDDEKYHTIRKLKEPIQVKGSEGGRYFLYPNGVVVNLGKKKPRIGNVTSTTLVHADVLSTIFIWITHNEQKFLLHWGCGNITANYAGARTRTQAEIMRNLEGFLNEHQRALEALRLRRRRHGEMLRGARRRRWRISKLLEYLFLANISVAALYFCNIIDAITALIMFGLSVGIILFID